MNKSIARELKPQITSRDGLPFYWNGQKHGIFCVDTQILPCHFMFESKLMVGGLTTRRSMECTRAKVQIGHLTIQKFSRGDCKVTPDNVADSLPSLTAYFNGLTACSKTFVW